MRPTELQKHASLPATPTLYDKAATAGSPKLARLFGYRWAKIGTGGGWYKKKNARRTNSPFVTLVATMAMLHFVSIWALLAFNGWVAHFFR